MNKQKIQFWIGLIVVLFGAALMFFGIWPTGTRVTIGIVGLLLIATSKYKLLK